jgi:hypothetical protein
MQHIGEAITTEVRIISDKDLARGAQIEKVVGGLAAGMSITNACKRAGISSKTWRRWKDEGLIQDLIADKFDDVMAGVRDLIANALPNSTKVLAAIAQGKIPDGTAIDGKLAPRDVVAAQAQLMNLYKQVGGDIDQVERDNASALEQLKQRNTSILTVNIDTVNVGTAQEPMPVPAGITLVDAEAHLVED